MPLVQTRGAASAQGFGEFAVTSTPTYIEDVFSCFLYTGTGATQTITNGIDLSGKGGLTILQCRSDNTGTAWNVYDTTRGVRNYLRSNSTAAQSTAGVGAGLTTFNSNGFTLGTSWNTENFSPYTYVSWTFRKQAKFFDVVTWTGTGSNTTIAHALGAVPGSIIVKRTDTTAAWAVYHRSLANTQYLVLNTTAAAATGATWWNSTTPTSSVFSVGTDASVNASGGTYVAYVFAHNAGGFGLTGTDNVISCESFTTNASGDATVNLGYEPQWVLIKRSSGVSDWWVTDNMRSFVATYPSSTLILNPNTASAETVESSLTVNSTGFAATGTYTSSTFIYVAIRRGPMKVPTTGTSVFGMSARAGTGANATVTGGQTDDAVLVKNRGSAVASLFSSRLTGTGYLVTATTAAEVAAGVTILQANPWDVMDGVKVGTTSTITNASANTYINYLFKRAPSFMDVVCYTGTGTASQVLTHNLTVIPTLTIFKKRSAVNPWDVVSGNTSYMQLNDTNAATPDTSIAATSTTITAALGAGNGLNASGATYVAYLFATLAGVSKVGSYTGNGSTQTIDCGLTAGARFVLLKRTDSTGDWYVYDTARGMTTLTDPYWLTDSSAAEVATLGSVTTVATGFAVNSAILAAINTNAATYIFLAVA